MEKTFYGQEIDYVGRWPTEWYGCPECGQSLFYCMCDNAQEYISELLELIKEKRDAEDS